MGELVRVDDAGPAEALALRGGGSAGAGGPFEAVGTLYLGEQRDQDDDQLRHRVGGAGGVGRGYRSRRAYRPETPCPGA